MISTVSQCLDTASALLNDTEKMIFTNQVLMPYFNMAYDELIVQLDLRQIPVLTERTEAQTLVIPPPTIPFALDLPDDFIRPIKLEEKAPSEADDRYMRMKEVRFITDFKASNTLGFYSWEKGQLLIPEYTSARTVRITYSKILPTPLWEINTPPVGDFDDPVGIQLIQLYLSNRTAALAAQSIMQDMERYSAVNSDANMWLGRIITIFVRNRQGFSVRRRPYGANWKSQRRALIVTE